MNLSPRQNEVYEALQEFIRTNGYPPTTRDLARKLGIVNPTAVKRMFDIFKEKGLLEGAPGKPRALKLKFPAFPFTEEVFPLPVAGRIVAGMPEEAIQQMEEKIPIPSFLAHHNPGAFLLKIKGDSMEPELHEGDLAVIHPQKTALSNDLAVVIREGEATVKQFLKRGEKFYLHPLNIKYPDLEIDENTRVIGKVTGLLRKF